MNKLFPEMKMKIQREFESLPAAWYCKHYGSGDGTKPWYITDTVVYSSSDGPTVVPLRLQCATYCPYILQGIFIDIGVGDFWPQKCEITLWSPTSSYKTDSLVSDSIRIPCKRTLDSIFFSGEYDSPHYQLPQSSKDTLHLFLSLLDNANEGTMK
jgi:hypothetical protein